MRDNKIGQMIISMAEIYGQNISEIGAMLYLKAIEGYDHETIEMAIGEHIRTSKWFPKPAELISIIRERHEGKKEARAALAWQKVVDTVRAGKWREGTAGSPLIDRAVRLMGGWNRMGEMLEKEIPFREREFVEKFRVIEESPELIDSDDAEILRRIEAAAKHKKPGNLIGGPGMGE